MAVENFIFMKDWHDLVEDAPMEEQYDFVWRIIHYGATGELIPIPEDWDRYRVKALNDAIKCIDKTKNEYENRVRAGETRGRMKSFDREELKRLIAAGWSGNDIATKLGVTKDAIYHDEVWRNRTKMNFYRDGT